jgi:hypothetical protein
MRVKRAICHAALIGATIFGGMAAVGQQQQTIQARISGGGGSGKNGTPVQWGAD